MGSMRDTTEGTAAGGGAPDLTRRLREAGAEELSALLAEHASTLDARQAIALLDNPHADAEMVGLLGERRDLLASYEIKRRVALHPAAPEVLARRLVPQLHWPDLLAAGVEMRLRPTVRRAADRTLAERLPGMSLGEKVSLARRAGLGLVQHLRADPQPRVMAALLDNPRMTEGVLLPVLARDTTPPPVLETVAGNRRWGVRYPVRVALARNPSTPVAAALRILPHLKRRDLAAVGRDVRIPMAVRKRAQLLGGEA